MKEIHYRHEYKTAVSPQDVEILRRRLSAVLKRDANAGPDGMYTIYNLYFDNADNKALNEKLAGVDNRAKFRLRYYNGDTSLIHLEKKSKENRLSHKEAAVVSADEVQRIIGGDIAWMKDAPDALLRELYVQMTLWRMAPKTISRYRREAYVYGPGNVRITLDSRMETALFARDFLAAADLPFVVSAGTATLLEVKYDAFLPDVVRDVIQLGNRRSSAFSKYVASRIYG
jgi:hypothetical protein